MQFYKLATPLVAIFFLDNVPMKQDVQEPESEPESSKFFRSRIGLGVKFNFKTGVGVGAGATIS